MTLELSDPNLLKTSAYFAGSWHSATVGFAVTDPADNTEIAQVADCGIDDLQAAITAAHTAQKEWAKVPAARRAEYLFALYDLMCDHEEDLAAILTAEMGKPLSEALGEIRYGASYVRWFAEEARRLKGELTAGPLPGSTAAVLRMPVGVVGAITPWNFPNAMAMRKAAPALAAGCSFILRPSELTPLSALAMAELADRCGIPAGVFNVVTSSNAPRFGKFLCESPLIDKISFTGSTRVGRILMQQCAPSLKRLSLELGGNAPFIVFEDADIEKAVDAAIVAKYRNAGQTCVCANRLFVHQAVRPEFEDRLTEKVKGLKVGPGKEPGVQIGPLITDAALAKSSEHIEDAVSKGARVLTGGQLAGNGGTFLQPTIVTGATPGMRVFSEETFGPVAPIFAFETEEDVIELANGTDFGLAAYFFSNDHNRIWRVAHALDVGMVGVNTGVISAAHVPFGGTKQSGFGREGSSHGLDDYTYLRYVCLEGAVFG